MERRKHSNFRDQQDQYQQEMKKQEKFIKRKKRVRKQRLFTMLILLGAIATYSLSAYSKQTEDLSGKKKEQKQYQQQLSDLKQDEEYLNQQIKNLNSDDYIADLARREYFLSQKNEIIFSIPKDK